MEIGQTQENTERDSDIKEHRKMPVKRDLGKWGDR